MAYYFITRDQVTLDISVKNKKFHVTDKIIQIFGLLLSTGASRFFI